MKIKDLDAKLTELKRLLDLKKELESAIEYFSEQRGERAKAAASANNISFNNGFINSCGTISLSNQSPISDKVHTLIKTRVIEVINYYIEGLDKQIEELEV